VSFRVQRYLAAAGLALFFCGCSRQPVTETRFLLNTYCKITVPAEEKNARAAIDSAFRRIDEIDKKFNVHRQASPLFEFNHNGTPVSEQEIVEVSLIALRLWKESSGCFDPTVYPLVKLWGFYGDQPSLPEKSAVAECLALVGGDKVEVRQGTLYPKVKGVGMDLGGLIPGYAANEALRVLQAAGVRSALIDTGGELYALGTIKGKPWKIGLKNPRGEGVIGIVEASDRCVVTSGDYEHFFEKDGTRYHHIRDPRTGYPAEGIRSVTVLGPDTLAADYLAKVVFIRGVEQGLAAIEQKQGYDAIIIDANGGFNVSSGLKDKFKRKEAKINE
jgi:thiamine biosynthesis lipoprotein